MRSSSGVAVPHRLDKGFIGWRCCLVSLRLRARHTRLTHIQTTSEACLSLSNVLDISKQEVDWKDGAKKLISLQDKLGSIIVT